jgi:hypothetical protein
MHNFIWEPGKSVISHCDLCGTTPLKECGCGIYAHRTLDVHIKTAYSTVSEPIVELAIWGIIHQFTEGYRAQYAKIVKIFLPRRGEAVPLAARAEALELTYMVPVEIIDLPESARGESIAYTPREKPLKIEDFELFVYSDDESIASFCRRELKKRYAQKIASAKRRLEYGRNIQATAEQDLAKYETKRKELK